MTAITSASGNHNHLSVTWDDGYTREFAYVWLRDNASEARHSNGQKLIETLEIPLDIQPESVKTGNPLVIQWPDSPTPSSYDADWLRHGTEPPTGHLQLWRGREMQSTLPRFSLTACESDEASLCQMLDSVHRLGFAIVIDIPVAEQSLFRVIDLFGYVRETNYGRLFDVRVEHNPSNMAFTNRTLSAHTDNPYRDPVPGLQLLHVLDNSADGGENTLADGLWAANRLRQLNAQAFELLANTPVDFRFRSDDADLHNRTTLIGLDRQGEPNAIRFNNRSMQTLQLGAQQAAEFYAAHRQLGELIEDPDNRILFKLEAGQAMLFDNTRILHGRLGYTGHGHRHLQGCYADKDSLTSKLRVLQRNHGNRP